MDWPWHKKKKIKSIDLCTSQTWFTYWVMKNKNKRTPGCNSYISHTMKKYDTWTFIANLAIIEFISTLSQCQNEKVILARHIIWVITYMEQVSMPWIVSHIISLHRRDRSKARGVIAYWNVSGLTPVRPSYTCTVQVILICIDKHWETKAVLVARVILAVTDTTTHAQTCADTTVTPKISIVALLTCVSLSFATMIGMRDRKQALPPFSHENDDTFMGQVAISEHYNCLDCKMTKTL